MKSPQINSPILPAIVLQKLFELERRGKYEDALSEISGLWTDISLPPDVSALEPFEAAEMLLRCGSLLGFYGNSRQIREAQQLSKDLLSNSKDRFLNLDMHEKAAECDTSLALACWRSGELLDADIWLEVAMAYDLPASNPTRLFTYVTRSLINLSNRRYKENLEMAERIEADLRLHGDSFLNGNFCINIGLSLKNEERISEALGQFELARFYHERSGHRIYLATVENNLAQLYKTEKRFERAHECIDHAAGIFIDIGDKTREGFALDTKALIFFAEGRQDAALEAIERAILVLDQTENAAYKMDAFVTKAKILLYLHDFTSAVLSLLSAVEIARVQIGEDHARSLVAEFEKTLLERDAVKPELPVNENGSIAEDDLQIVLPPSLAHYDDYQGIWITNKHLESIGLAKGSIGIIVDEKISRGDLIALSEIANNAISCGFYDAEFGIVCLSGVDSEPNLFNESEVRILGKIVGYCRYGESSDGKLIVEPVKST